jgi:hypothetical protein
MIIDTCTITFTTNNTEDRRFRHIDKQNLETTKMETFLVFGVNFNNSTVIYWRDDS